MKIHCKYDQLVDPARLNDYPKNRNKHDDAQLVRLVKLYKHHGIRHPIIVDPVRNVIAAGHGRKYAAIKGNLKEFPVVYQKFETDDDLYAFAVSDNGIALWAELDLSGINTDFIDLGPDFDIDLLGIKDFVLDPADKVGLTDEDDVPEAPKTPKTKMGDLYQLDGHRLLCGDSTKKEDVERLMNGEKAAMWASDPPYGINHVEVANEKGQAKGYEKIANDELQDEALQAFIHSVISVSLPSMKKGFAFYMWHAMKMQAYFSQAAAAAAAAGLLFHRQIIWVKPNFVFGRGQYHWRHELCLMGWLKGDEPPFYGERNQSTVWEIARENDKVHPTQKPVAIWESPIHNHTRVKEIIYEPFSGSGSQLIACDKLDRRCFGIEIDPVYCDVIVERWEKFSGKKAVLLTNAT